MRTPLIAGNWKMNPPSRSEARDLAAAVAGTAAVDGVLTLVCPPTIWLRDIALELAGRRTAIGAQTMHHADSGAYTGETSPVMLSGVADFVIIGHSERRQYDNETDASVALKVAAAVRHGLRPIAAIGERVEERRAGQTEAVIERQLRAAISGLEHIEGTGLVIAYEPVWAIGTGDAASAGDAQSAAVLIRGILREHDPAAADVVPILYGGSCTPDNAADFFAEPDVDGALVGGASLDPAKFAAIVRAAAPE